MRRKRIPLNTGKNPKVAPCVRATYYKAGGFDLMPVGGARDPQICVLEITEVMPEHPPGGQGGNTNRT